MTNITREEMERDGISFDDLNRTRTVKGDIELSIYFRKQYVGSAVVGDESGRVSKIQVHYEYMDLEENVLDQQDQVNAALYFRDYLDEKGAAYKQVPSSSRVEKDLRREAVALQNRSDMLADLVLRLSDSPRAQAKSQGRK
jgi:hypothetical protein